jgi:hypothetical protein
MPIIVLLPLHPSSSLCRWRLLSRALNHPRNDADVNRHHAHIACTLAVAASPPEAGPHMRSGACVHVLPLSVYTHSVCNLYLHECVYTQCLQTVSKPTPPLSPTPAAAAIGVPPPSPLILPLMPKLKVFDVYAAAAAAADSLIYNGGTSSLDAVAPPSPLPLCRSRVQFSSSPPPPPPKPEDICGDPCGYDAGCKRVTCDV